MGTTYPVGRRWQISVGGGSQPDWRADGRELFYRADDGRIMSVAIRAEGTSFEYGTSVSLFQSHTVEAVPYFRSFAAAPDGQRFLVATITDPGMPPAITLLFNWATGLRP